MMYKRIFSFIIATIMFFCCIPIQIFATTGQPNARNISQNLTIHYDFEGNSEAEYYSDKATAGESSDSLSIQGTVGTQGNISVSNGVATSVVGTEISSPRDYTKYCGVWLSTAANADVKATNGEGTFFMRFKLGDIAEPWRNTVLFAVHQTDTNTGVNKFASGPIMFDFDKEGQNIQKWRINTNISNGNRTMKWYGGELSNAVPPYAGYTNTEYDADTWFNLFVVLKKGEDDIYERSIYVGTSEKDVELLATDDLGSAALLDSDDTTKLSLFGFTAQERRANVSIDDFRYYNTDLTLDEMRGIRSEFDGEYSRNIEDHLTIHYDFEGKTDSEYFADKATAGESKDNLTIKGTVGAHGDITVSSGVATSQSSTTYNDYCGVWLSTGANEDVANTTGEGTFFIRFKLSEVSQVWRNTVLFAVHKTNSTTGDNIFASGPIMLDYDIEGTTKKWRINSNIADGSRKMSSVEGKFSEAMPPYVGYENENYDGDLWWNAFVVFSKASDNSMNRIIYVGTSDSNVLIEVSSESLGNTGLLASDGTTKLSLFGFTEQERRANLSVDDFRYYNIDLTLDEMQGIVTKVNNPCTSGNHTRGEKEIVDAPDCKNEGKYVIKCVKCGVELGNGSVPTNDEHTPGEWVVDKEATATEQGKKHQNCTLCNAIVSIEQIPALNSVDAPLNNETQKEDDTTQEMESDEDIDESHISEETTESETNAEDSGCGSSVLNLPMVLICMLAFAFICVKKCGKEI